MNSASGAADHGESNDRHDAEQHRPKRVDSHGHQHPATGLVPSRQAVVARIAEEDHAEGG